MLNHVLSWFYVGDESRPLVVLNGLPVLYELKYDSVTTCGLPLYLCSHKLDSSATHGMRTLSISWFQGMYHRVRTGRSYKLKADVTSGTTRTSIGPVPMAC